MRYSFIPGPWVAEIQDSKPVIVTQNEPHTIVCELNNVDLPMAQMVANARLISAAPELLDVALLSRDLIDLLEPMFALVDANGGKAKVAFVLESIDAVITKAIGGAK